MMIVDNQYNIGDIVYLKTDEDQLPRQVYSIELYHNGELMYKLVQGIQTSSHYEFELSYDKNLVTM